MPYRGFSGGGFVGNFLSTALLEQLRPAADNAGRQATVGSPATVAAPYRSDGNSWKAVALLPASTNKLPILVAEKTAVTDGAIQTADQVIGTLSIPAASLIVGDCFRVLETLGRDTNADVYGTVSHRMGTAGTVADTTVGQANFAAVFPSASGGLSIGQELWWRVVSIGTNSVVEKLGIGNGGNSWSAGTSSSAAVATQFTLTGYNLTTQAGFFTLTTTMGAATTTKPRTGYMRLEVQV
jgi:hypothetical protein